jgi:hypothetical protein
MQLIDMKAIKRSMAWRKFAEWCIEESPSKKQINGYLGINGGDMPEGMYHLVECYRDGLVNLDLGIKELCEEMEAK